MRIKVFNIIAFSIAVSAIHLHFSPVATSQEPNNTQRRGSVDWIFVLDTSASMRGAGGTSDIFDRVKTALEIFINNTAPGDSVTVYTFDRDTTLRPTVRISDNTDRRDLVNTIRGLDANGDRTHTGKAVRDAIDRARELRARGESEHRTLTIVLLTDGIEDVRGIPNPVPILSNVKPLSETQPYLFYVSLGEEHDPQLDSLVRNQGHGEVIRAASANDIQNIVDRIRPIVEAAASPTPSPTPVQVNIHVEPINLNFGEIKPGNQTRSEILNLTSNTNVVVQLSLNGQSTGIDLIEPSGAIALQAGQVTSVDVRLAAARAVFDGQRTLSLKANVRRDVGDRLPPDAEITVGSVECRLAVKHVPIWYTLLKWFIVILVILLLALGGYCVYSGTTPRGLLEAIGRRRLLEGELEVLRPKLSQPEQAFINLAGLKSRRLVLSQVVPEGAVHDADAELETARTRGLKLIRLRRTDGNVRVNGAEVSFADLYDGDMIELGNARLRFNWLNGHRPDETGDAFN
jgi:VWA domain-containing protein